MTKTEKIRRLLGEGKSAKEIAAKLKVSAQYVYTTKYQNRKTKKKSEGAAPPVEPTKPVDMVNHPPHYTVGGIETIDFIEAKKLSYNLGNAVKYIARADYKGNMLEDLMKARFYLDREISKIKA